MGHQRRRLIRFPGRHVTILLLLLCFLVDYCVIAQENEANSHEKPDDEPGTIFEADNKGILVLSQGASCVCMAQSNNSSIIIMSHIFVFSV